MVSDDLVRLVIKSKHYEKTIVDKNGIKQALNLIIGLRTLRIVIFLLKQLVTRGKTTLFLELYFYYLFIKFDES